MHLKTVLLAAVATFALATPSLATPILSGSQLNIGGFVQGGGGGGGNNISRATSLDFTAGGGIATPGVAGVLSDTSGTGSFSGIACNTNCGSINDVAAISTFTGLLFTLTGGLSFTLGSPVGVTRIDASANTLSTLILNGSGTLGGGGFDTTASIFQLTAQGGRITTFSASAVANAVAVPEPMSLALFSMGLIGLGLVSRRKAA